MSEKTQIKHCRFSLVSSTLTQKTIQTECSLSCLPPQEALREGGKLAFPVFDEVPLGHEVVELLSFLRHHHPCVLLHSQPQTCNTQRRQRPYQDNHDLCSNKCPAKRNTSPNFIRNISSPVQCHSWLFSEIRFQHIPRIFYSF